MPDTTPDDLLAPSQVPSISGRPIRKDEIELADRGIYVESWLPERRSRRKPLLFVHGELGGSWLWERYLGYFRRTRLGRPRPQPQEPSLEPDGRPGRAVVRALRRRCRRGDAAARARGCRGRSWHGRPPCPEGRRAAIAGGSRSHRLRDAGELRLPAHQHELRARSRSVSARPSSAGRRCPSGSSAITATSRSRTSSGSST